MKNYKIILFYLLALLAIGCGSVKKKSDIYTVSEKKVDSLYYSSNIETKPPVLSSLTINEICDSVTNEPVKFKKEFIIKNDTIVVETVNNELQISINLAEEIIKKQDSIIEVHDSQYKELKESHTVKNKIPFKYWVALVLSVLMNLLFFYLLIKSKVSFKNLI